MTKDDIIHMARTAGLQRIYGACAEASGESSYEDWDYEIERFAELIAAAEREACAKAAENVVPRHTECGNKIAAAIRARGDALTKLNKAAENNGEEL